MIGDVRIRLTSYNGVWKKRDLKGGTLKEEKERERVSVRDLLVLVYY